MLDRGDPKAVYSAEVEVALDEDWYRQAYEKVFGCLFRP